MNGILPGRFREPTAGELGSRRRQREGPELEIRRQRILRVTAAFLRWSCGPGDRRVAVDGEVADACRGPGSVDQQTSAEDEFVHNASPGDRLFSTDVGLANLFVVKISSESTWPCHERLIGLRHDRSIEALNALKPNLVSTF